MSKPVKSAKVPAEQRPPTPANPTRQHHQMAVPKKVK